MLIKASNSIKKPSVIIIASIIIITIIASVFILLTKSGSSSQKNVNASTGDLIIPVDELSNTAKFYSYNADGVKMQIIAVKASDNTVRTAFNTCQVCYSSGKGYYKLEGNELVCQNCGNHFTSDQIALKQGGCNPVPITSENREQSDNKLIISKDFLQQASVIFKNWKN